MQLKINSFRQLFPYNIFSLTLSTIPDIFLTAVKFPYISRFSRQVITLKYRGWNKDKFAITAFLLLHSSIFVALSYARARLKIAERDLATGSISITCRLCIRTNECMIMISIQ